MPAGSPLPLVLEYPLAQLISLLQPLDSGAGQLGVWLRDLERAIPMCVIARGRCCRMLLSGDLGFLLGRCSHIVIRQGEQARVHSAELIIHWRALQVVTGLPCLPKSESLQEIFPGVIVNDSGFRVPVQRLAPEAVLAECLTHGIPVAESRITYASS